MRTYLDCYPCFLRQALDAARRAGASEEQQRSVIRETLTALENLRGDETPPEIAHRVHGVVRGNVAADDPYKEAKTEGTRRARALYPRLKALVEESDDPLDTAIRVSIAGNIMDLGVADRHDDLWDVVERVLDQEFAIDDRAVLRSALEDADHVLFIGDNAGETVCDRVLVETLPVPVTYAVKGGPVLNDATMEDAVAAGLDRCATLITSGSDVPGTILAMCSTEFRRHYEAAPLIICKGHGNYESLSQEGPRVFCLLQVKCPIIGRDIGASTGSIVVRQGAS